MAGFLLACIPILTLGLGGVEAAHWAGLRQTLSLALMQAARAGVTQQARPQVIARAFEHGLRMLYPDAQAANRALHAQRRALGTPWRIRIVLPSRQAFQDHADPDLRGPRDHPGQPLIRNDYQARQHALRLAQGWPAGRGPRSGLTIYEANTLVLDLWWPHRPLMPGVAALIRALAPLAGDPAQARLMTAGYLPFRRRVSVTMQSHPAAWPDLADGRIHHGTAPGASPGPDSAPPDTADIPEKTPAGENELPTAPAPGQDPDTPQQDPDLSSSNPDLPPSEPGAPPQDPASDPGTTSEPQTAAPGETAPGNDPVNATSPSCP
ncbi:MAG: hypothetical protein ACK5JE_00045 [Castellaniella sp.]|uniref:hypothetical protein n=1 Tax=Castellaniella sp. TaxID=1955812 RepID=UPI003A88514F